MKQTIEDWDAPLQVKRYERDSQGDVHPEEWAAYEARGLPPSGWWLLALAALWVVIMVWSEL